MYILPTIISDYNLKKKGSIYIGSFNSYLNIIGVGFTQNNAEKGAGVYIEDSNGYINISDSYFSNNVSFF